MVKIELVHILIQNMNLINVIRIPEERSTAFLFLLVILSLDHCASMEKTCADGECENGMGVQELADGSRYLGNFDSSEREGLGKIIYQNQDTFDGTFQSNLKQGHGIYKYANLHRFEGNYEDNVRTGPGRYYYSEIEYFEGVYEQGLRVGQGTYVYPNGDKFEGLYREGKRNGPGRYIFADKNYLEGIWIENLLEGKAIIRNPKGKIIHEGYWKNNKYLGMENPEIEKLDQIEIPNTQ
ncbi:hypothetical protein EHQ58_07470 [Leptospira ognonensis]|uniref:Membrane-binding protein n=2 Tax=Leptospira ognonensis TaxID=2484945 RepID=A0A4V3JRI1_9LEPT|nr:hypothetical protein EHQ58_07470 [Leptospira ognonensis]